MFVLVIARNAVGLFHCVRIILLGCIDSPSTVEWLFTFSSVIELCGAIMTGKINGGGCLLQPPWNLFITDCCMDFV